MLCDALVHAFVAAADKDDLAAPGEPLEHGLVHQLPLRRQQHPPWWGIPTVSGDLGQCVIDRLDLHDHALSAAERPVIHGPVHIRCPLPQVVQDDLHQACVAGPSQNAARERPVEELREDRQDVKPHVRPSALPCPAAIAPRCAWRKCPPWGRSLPRTARAALGERCR